MFFSEKVESNLKLYGEITVTNSQHNSEKEVYATGKERD